MTFYAYEKSLTIDIALLFDNGRTTINLRKLLHWAEVNRNKFFIVQDETTMDEKVVHQLEDEINTEIKRICEELEKAQKSDRYKSIRAWRDKMIAHKDKEAVDDPNSFILNSFFSYDDVIGLVDIADHIVCSILNMPKSKRSF